MKKFQIDYADSAPLSGVHKTGDGYLAANVKVARTGIQLYDGAPFDRPNETIRVYRPETEVFSDESLKSYAHRPVTIGHPSENVDSKNWKKHSVGHTGGKVVRDGDFVNVSMLVMDGDAINQIESSKRELSMGYSTTVIMEDGITPDGEEYDAIQTELRMNHLAIVAKARGGSVLRIGDVIETEKDEDMTDVIKTQTVMVDGLPIVATEASAIALNRLMEDKASLETKLRDTADELKKEVSTRDTQIGELTAKIKNLEDKNESLDLDQLVADRADLVALCRAIDSSIDPKGKTDNELRRAVVAKKLDGIDVKDHSDDVILGMFQVVSKDADPVRSQFKGGFKEPSTHNVRASDEAYDEVTTAMQDAWRDPKSA